MGGIYGEICTKKGIYQRKWRLEEAITYDEQPVDFGTSWNQRMRWSLGMMQCGRLYRCKLISKFFRSGDLSCVDKFMFTLGPFMQVLSFLLNIVVIIFKYIGIEFHPLYIRFFSLGFTGFAITYIIGTLINAFVVGFYRRNIFKSMHGILLFGVFVTTWIPINILCLFKKNVKWIPVKHTSKSNIKNIMTEMSKE